ncbi:lycopene cyclase domain-containing protein [Georgenia faecalis]|uniref:Lycopene cyclase domain-containing protein n=1 Tax=Georgenia faecalis TaxID=2483799 RepID=A0ABV9D5V3_9MICO|nr:lycopene cyclase domain-containing protein [Georgenia faecalis]
MSAAYLLVLLVCLGAMTLLDHRFRLFFFADARRAALVLAAGTAGFLLWDVAGIASGLFFRGQTPYMTGLLLAPELPVEELVFLAFLSYLTMNLYTGASLLLQRRAR